MKEPLHFDFEFKEKRNYVHGTDIFNRIIGYLQEKGYIKLQQLDLSIHAIMNKQLKGFFVDCGGAIDEIKPSVVFSFQQGQQCFKIALAEDTEEVTGRYAYPEDDIVDLADIDKEKSTIILSKPIGYSNIEKVVALNKGLLQAMFPDVEGKWLFTRLKLEEGFLPDPKEIKVRLVKNSAFRLTKSEISMDGKIIGQIFFSLMK
jgi:hypothetical protein